MCGLGDFFNVSLLILTVNNFNNSFSCFPSYPGSRFPFMPWFNLALLPLEIRFLALALRIGTMTLSHINFFVIEVVNYSELLHYVLSYDHIISQGIIFLMNLYETDG